MTDHQEAEKVVRNCNAPDTRGEALACIECVAQALTKARQGSNPDCLSDNRCIICAECEAKIVSRQKEKDARVAEITDVSRICEPHDEVCMTVFHGVKEIAQTIRKGS